MEWMPAQCSLIKVPLTISRIAALESNPIIGDSLRRYSSGGQVGWIASPENPQTFEAALIDQGLAALAIFGPPGRARLGCHASESFEQRVKAALDPNKRFVEA